MIMSQILYYYTELNQIILLQSAHLLSSLDPDFCSRWPSSIVNSFSCPARMCLHCDFIRTFVTLLMKKPAL